MNPRQRAKCFALFGDLRDVLRARGKTNREIEAFRDVLTVRAIGRHKSWNDFNDDEVDALIGKIKAETAPADFNAQLKQQEMPERRVSLLLARIESLTHSIGKESHYVDGISRRMFGEQYHKLPERELQQIEGVLRKHLHRMPFTVERIAEEERLAAEHAAKTVAIVYDPRPTAAPVHTEAEPFF